MSDQYSQRHFVIYELILPYCTVCTPIEGETKGWNTPITCQESSDATYSLFFTQNKTPNLIAQTDLGKQSISTKSVLNSKIFKCVEGGSESTAKLKAGEGMASRGTMSINCIDFRGDPGPIEFSEMGTFFGKLVARNVLQNKKILSHYYTIAKNPTTKKNELTLRETHTHFVDDFQLTEGKFTLTGKDALKDIEAFGEKFPAISEIELTGDIDSSQVVIPVSDASLLTDLSVFRIEEELFYVQSSSGNNVTVAARGTSLVNGSDVVYKTNVSEHSAESTVQPCYTLNNTFLSDVLEDIFKAVGLNAYIDYAQWNEEITTWTSQAFNFDVWSEPTKVSELLDNLCSKYMIDMWLDQPSQKVKVSASTAWKNAIRILNEGNDIQDLKIKQSDSNRFSRAFMYNKKEYKAENDDTINYGKVTSASDLASETSDLYGKVKEKDMGKSSFITPGSAQTTVSRYVQRFSRTPKEISFNIEERKLGNTSISDIIDIVSRDTQTASGEYLQARDRAQIIRIQPKLNEIGRKYEVSALSYIPLISTDGGDLVITLSGSLIDVNLYSRAGAPADAVNVTYIFDGCIIGSSEGTPAVRAGAFPAGSVIKIICINNTKWSAKGGDGGYVIVPNHQNLSTTIAIDAINGSDSYQSDGVESHVYLNYGTVDGYATSSELFAAGGGGGAAHALQSITFFAYANGGGGSGVPGGNSELSSLGPTQGSDGNFNSYGSGGVGYSVYLSPSLRVIGGNGGFSSDGFDYSIEGSWSPSVVYANKGLAGGAFKSTSITVYNLASESNKLRAGNSDAFTLIDA